MEKATQAIFNILLSVENLLLQKSHLMVQSNGYDIKRKQNHFIAHHIRNFSPVDFTTQNEKLAFSKILIITLFMQK